MPMTATARSIDGGLAREVDVNGRHTIMTDEPAGVGGSDRAPAPHELLPAMLASCVSTMLSIYARNRGWDIGGAQVRVVYDPDSAPRGIDVAIDLPADLGPDRVRRLEHVARTCPVRRALEAGFEFHESVTVPRVHATA